MTNNYPEFVESRLAPNHRLLHIAIGLVGEWYEYIIETNKLEQIEELGDLCFYLQAGHNYYNPQLQLFPVTDIPYQVYRIDVEKRLYDFLDHVKKQEIYGNHQPSLPTKFQELCQFMSAYINQQGTISHIISDNMFKLTKRYPTTFTPKDAEERKDKQ